MIGPAASRPRVAVGTIVAANYLAFARVLANSFHEHHPDVPFFVVVLDHRGDSVIRRIRDTLSRKIRDSFEIRKIREIRDPLSREIRDRPLASLGIPHIRDECFRRSLQELAVLAKPYLLRHLLDRGFGAAVFLDPDVLVVGDLTPVVAAVAEHAVTLTPHLLGALGDQDRIARELNIVQSGTINAGFIGVSERSSARRFLTWWQDRLHGDCSHDVARGVYYDQRWLDLAPVLFEDVWMIRDPGCNVGHWNLPERQVSGQPDAILVDGAPGRFFHFSGFDPAEPQRVSRHAQRLRMAGLGSAAAVFDRYAGLLRAAGHHTTSCVRYSFDYFDNGVPISTAARARHRDLGEEAARFGDPFETGGRESFFSWWSAQQEEGRKPTGGRE